MGIRRTMALFMVLAFSLGLFANGCSSDETSKVHLLSIQVDPAAAKIVAGETKQYTATGTFDDLSTRDVSSEVVWLSSNESAATISQTGLATGVTEGTTTIITAAAGNLVSNDASLEVVSESNRLVSIAIEPTTAQIQLGASLSFAAIGTYQDNSTRTITEEVFWESTNPTIVNISNTPGSKGVAVGLASGSSEITASALDVTSDPVTATVTEVALETISVSPADPTLPLGTTQKFKATGTYSDNSTADLTHVVTWMSSNKLVADFSVEPGEEGFCTTLAEGSTSITAIRGSVISDPVTLTVTSASLVEITIEPTAPSVPVGTEVQFSATGIYSDGGTHDLTESVAWYTGDETKVAFESATAGLALAKAEGSAEIWCSRNQLESNRATMTVSSATLESIEISPVNPNVPIGQQIQLTAFGHYSDQNVVDITNTAAWASTVPTIATVSNAAGSKGQVTGLTEGSTVISAEIGAIKGEATLQVKNIEIISIVVTPAGISLPEGEKQQYTATATFNDSSQAEVTDVVTWHVGSTLVAEIGNSASDHGLATAIGTGNTTVWCVSTNGVASSPVGLTVTSATLVSIVVTPDNPSVVIGSTQQFTATGRYTDGSQLDITPDVLWESSDEAVATISNSAGTKGLATTSTEGATNITATKDTIASPPSRLSVVSPTLESITVTPSNANIDVGVTIQYTAMGHYSDNQDRDITPQCYWESSNTAIASVSNAAGTRGEVTGNAEGSANITASYQTITSTAVPVTVNTPVNQQPVAVLEGDATATVGAQATFTGASSYDPDGSITNYTFNFGDGTGDQDNGTDPVINHTFTSANTFTVVMTVTDNLGATDADTMQVAVTTEPNNPPNAVMICPSSGQIGQSLQFDASNSTDSDGTIVNYTFNFGDGTGDHDNALNPLIFHTFTTESTFQVRLIVTDDKGAQDSFDCQVPIGATTIPEVVIIRPQGRIDVTQDQALSVLVDANGQGGFSVTKVELLADGSKVSEDTTAPYEFDYTVPTAAVTGSTITLIAKAYDNNTPAGVGQSQPVFLDVRNYPPAADFTATISDALEVTLDATSCSDNETPLADLEVRWDWESDGTWDTAWSTTKVLTHTYALDGTYTITMEVRDSVLQTDDTSRTVDLASQQTVGGTISASTTWYGTIIVTGSVTIPDGVVLDINPNTQILVMYLDQDTDGYGDFGIYVEGSGEIHVNGTDEAPVLFTIYGSDHKVPGAWQGVKVSGTGSSTFDYAIFEYAKIGLELQAPCTLNNCTFRFNKDIGLYLYNNSDSSVLNNIISHDNDGEGIVLYGADGVDMDNITAQDNGDTGLRFTGCTNDAMDVCIVTRNGSDGIQLVNSTAAIADCTITYNAGYGTLYSGSSAGSMTHSEIKYNDDVGIRAESSSQSAHPHPIINYNNIYGNSVVAGTATFLVDTSAVLTVTGERDYGDHYSSVWNAPDSGIIRRVLIDYDDIYYATGYLLQADDTQIASYSSSYNNWRWLASSGLNGIRVKLYNSYTSDSSLSNKMSVTQLEYTTQVTSGLEMSVAVISGYVDARYNYWGVFPNILDHITYTSPSSLDIQGFVGLAFDQTWNTGPYKAGDLDTETWSGTIYITGDTNVASDKTLTVDAGTNVLFVPIDQDYDGVGDYGLYVAGTMAVNGTSGSRVSFTSHGAAPTTSSFDRVEIAGTGSSLISYADFTYGAIGMELGDSSTLEYCTFANNNQFGLYLLNADNSTVRYCTIENNQDIGVRVSSTSGLYASYLTVRSNAGDGIQAQSNTDNYMLEDSTIRENGGAGLVLTNSSWDITYCAILYNGGEGIRYVGNSGGTIDHSNIKYNDLPGVFIRTSGSSNPSPAISNSNIYGNSVDHSVQAFLEDTSATLTVTGERDYGDHYSSVWSISGTGYILRALIDYDDIYYATGYLLQSNDTQIASYSSSYNNWRWLDSSNLSGLRVKLYNSYTSDSSLSNKMSVTDVEYLMDVAQAEIEMTLALVSGTISANHNYWGQDVGESPSDRISTSRANAIDFTSWELSEVTPCGPR